jgi:hypothetical protein
MSFSKLANFCVEFLFCWQQLFFDEKRFNILFWYTWHKAAIRFTIPNLKLQTFSVCLQVVQGLVHGKTDYVQIIPVLSV